LLVGESGQKTGQKSLLCILVVRAWQKMDKLDKRKYPRIKIYYLISYIGLDENEHIVEQQMGVALDINQNGILIETACITESKHLIVMAVDHKNNLIEIKGKVICSRLDKAQKYKTGVSFQGPHSKNIEFAKKIIKAFYYQKNQGSPRKVLTK